MENHGSNEKLVGLEAGLAWPEKPKNPIFAPAPIRKSVCSNKLLRRLLLLLTIVLLLAAAFEVHRAVSDQLPTEEFSTRDGPGQSERALTRSSENSGETVDADTVRNERLSKLRDGINEFKESTNKFEPTAIPVTTTIVPRTTSRIAVDITDELMSKLDKVNELETRIEELDDVFRESEADIDWAKAAQIYGDVWAALRLFEQTIHSELQRSGFPVNDYLDDPRVETTTESTTEIFESVPTVAPTEESESSWSWHFSFGNWASSSSDPETTEGPVDTENNQPDVETSSKKSRGFMSRIHIFPFSMSWGWNSEDEDENPSPDGVAREATTSESEETSTAEPRELSAEISEPLNSPITEDYDYSSEDYYSYIFDNYMDQSEADETTGKTPLLEPEMGSVTSGSSTEELEDGIRIPTTATPPVSSPESPLPIIDKEEEEESEPEKIISDKSVPTAPHFYKVIFKDGEFHISDTLDDTTAESLGHDDLVKISRGLTMPNTEDQDYSMYPEYDNWLDLDKMLPDLHDYSDFRDFLVPPIPRLSDQVGTRSKRFVNNARPAQGAVDDEFLTEQSAGDMAVLQQAIDDENHVIRNEISETDGRRKLALQEKLNRYYKKMESISAHIDRLHKKLLRLNSLNDDYVSREFPPNE